MPKKKPLTKEQKRAEMRKRGIFVEADDTEMDYSDMEKMASVQHPAVCHMRTRRLKWKKDSAESTREESPPKRLFAKNLGHVAFSPLDCYQGHHVNLRSVVVAVPKRPAIVLTYIKDHQAS
ncbi:unnamed protein product [Strongylus vulgaris]|uniref:Uncharacterized protein n=1 Tax=Strongylus vulgaris TaxID=40348 RepID=A0A3P7LNN1_STRVU|nr:unnamed protein product [Strongylus vulgaris]